ncbi:hypothetical protein [Nitrincola sp.]|uniref:hypothetical protein n=1 Tax=Nitrincola sp. TaxID=1926584 RepID=UPI003A95D98F
MAIQQPYKIGLSGFGKSEQTMLELFFNSRHQKVFVLTQPDKADVLLVDLSGAAGEMQFLKLLRQHPACAGLPGIALTEGGDVPQGFIELKRPLTLNGLSTELEHLTRVLQKHDPVKLVASDRDTVFAEWQARKQAGLDAMQKWNKGKQLSDSGKTLFPLDRHGVQEVISKAHLVMAHRRHESTEKKVPDTVEESVDVVDESAAEMPVAEKPGAKPVVEQATEKVDRKRLDQDSVNDYCGHLPDQDLTEPSGLRRVHFNMESSLLPWVVLAVKTGRQSKQAQQVSGLPGVLIYLPEADCFYCDLDAELLLHMARARFGLDELFLTKLEPSAYVLGETGRHIAADQLLWKLALLTSRGRIPETIDLNKPVQLIRKPDFSVFELTPHARTLAELWFSKRLSPRQVLSELAVPQRFVFTFLVAADAVGFFNP